MVQETVRKTLTLREIMADGRKGKFAQALYALYGVIDSGDFLAIYERLRDAYHVADQENTKRLQRAFRRAWGITEVGEKLVCEWPGLRRLDEEMDDPFSFDLRGEPECQPGE